MPLMTRIRESLSKVFAVFAGVFVVYIVLDWGMDITGQKQASQAAGSQEVGKINNHPILYQEFSEIVRQTAENQKAQTGVEPDENQLRSIRDQVWNQLIEQELYEQEIKRLGITVTDQEIVNWVRGDTPPDFLRQQFTDSLGSFNRQAYEAAMADPKNKPLLVKVEEFLRRQREREKLQSVVLAGVRVTEGEVLQKFSDQHMKYDIDYLFIDANQQVKDEEVVPTEEELRAYYNEHAAEFKIEATRKLKYVLFQEKPSRGDTDAVEQELKDLRSRAEAGVDFMELATTYSETPPNDAFVKHGELGQEKEEKVFSAKPGDLIGPFSEFDGYHLIKVVEFKDGTEDFIRASHVLVNVDAADSAASLAEAREVVAEARQGNDFGELARKHSDDPSSAARGGDLGWFGKGRMVKPFEDAAYGAKIGQIVGPVRTQFGYHIIKVTARDRREVKLIDIHLSVTPSAETKDQVFQQAQDFGFAAKERDFLKEAQGFKYNIVESPSFQKNAAIPGIGMNPGVSKFAFEGDVGDVSEPYRTQNGYAVFMISESKEAGVRSLEEVKTAIDARVRREKKLDKLQSTVQSYRQQLSSGDSLRKISGLPAGTSVQRLSQFALAQAIPGVGRDLDFVGATMALKPNEISPPVRGQRGWYLIQVLSASPFDSAAYNVQKESIRTQLLRERRNRFLSEWSNNLKKAADIVDNRDNFYR